MTCIITSKGNEAKSDDFIARFNHPKEDVDKTIAETLAYSEEKNKLTCASNSKGEAA
jgi:hypothetical protein